MPLCEDGDEIVISGISGTFPESENVRVLHENLLAKKDLVTDDDRRWKIYDGEEVPRRMGKIKEINKFDSFFFGMNEKQATSMDPQARILLEKTYEAIIDAGYNPKEFKGSRTGVFIGTAQADTHKLFDHPDLLDAHTIPGTSKAMLANRISYWLDVHGVSYAIDTACSSSAYAFDNAYRAMRSGDCTAAIVGGCTVCLVKSESKAFHKLGVLSYEGKCKCFDESGDGFVRSEAVVVMLLQKKKCARRMYARVVHAKANCDGYKTDGVHVPSTALQQKLLKEIYEECHINPNELQYLEAHATGTKAGDPTELKTIEEVFLKNRQLPLKIGSVKSNIGHTESASALCSITKLILNFESGILLPNIHFKVPRSDVEVLHNGKLNVITEPTAWKAGLAACNNFGFGGANCHVLLEPNPKIKEAKHLPDNCVPPLVCVSGRTEEAVDTLLKDLEEKQVDAEYIALYHEIHKYDIPGHVFRGYTILMVPEHERIRSIQNFVGEQRPVWFVFAGVGSQWPTMGKSLLKIPVCEQAIRKCHQILLSKNVDLLEILTKDDASIFDNILNTFLGIVATQIALVDLLKSVGVVPDGYVGHSLGELGCAYTDGCLTAEQTILLAYYRGIAILESKFIRGSMAAIGLKYDEVENIIPSDIDIACHNSPKSVTVSGPTEAIESFVEYVSKSEVFARRVNSSSIPLHSRYMKEACEKLLQYGKKVVIEPKLRSHKWISTSFLEKEWDLISSKYASAEYFVRNTQGVVYFEEASHHIPENAIVIEIAPHGLLQGILKQSLSNSNTNIPLTSRNTPDNLLHLLTALGKIFEVGLDLQISKLYAPVEFPVSRGTPMISPLIKWNHIQDWHVYKEEDFDGIMYGQRVVHILLEKKQYAYLSGHKFHNTVIYPASGYLVLVWETFSWMMDKSFRKTSIIFSDVRFLRATKIPSKGSIKFFIHIKKNTGDFEIMNRNELVVSGKIHLMDDNNITTTYFPPLTENTLENIDPNTLEAGEEFYRYARLTGCQYEGVFRGISRFHLTEPIGIISWNDHFVGFLDSLFQLYTPLNDNLNFDLRVPTYIGKLVINTKRHFSMLNSGKSEFLSCCDKNLKLLQCGGVEMENYKFNKVWITPTRENTILESILFIPYMNSKLDDLSHAVTICLQIILENLRTKELKIVELIDNFTNKSEPLLNLLFSEFIDRTPFVHATINVLTTEEHLSIIDEQRQRIKTINELDNDEKLSLLIVSHISERKEILNSCLTSLHGGGFLLIRETISEKMPPLNCEADMIFQCHVGNEEILLFRKVSEESTDDVTQRIPVKITSDSYSWISEVQKNLSIVKSNKSLELILYAEKDPFTGILGFFNCIDKEIIEEKCRCFVMMDENIPDFSILQPFYQSQLNKNLKMNVYMNGTWGTYRHVPLSNTTVPSFNAYLNVLTYGDLSTLQWVNDFVNADNSLENGTATVHVYCAALNFRDVMIATKRIPPGVFSETELEEACLIGTEFAGRTEDGRRFMGMAKAKAIANVVETTVDNIWPVPDHWSLEEAATVPVVYCTVLYALFIRGSLKKGEKILIHSGTGGIGLAAINICLNYECEIFTTVGTQEKKDFLLKTFPQILPSHIGNSRDDSFEFLIRRMTKGEGVNLVLNSLAERKLQASVRCLAKRGRFLELGKFDLAMDNALGMRCFLEEISFHGIDLAQVFSHKEILKEIDSLMQTHIKDNVIKPLPKTVFDINEVEKAFRFMITGKHIGKLLIKIRDEEPALSAKPNRLLLEAVPRFLCRPEKTYVICGGLGGLGLQLGFWLVVRGARKLVLSSRKGMSNTFQKIAMRSWKLNGVKVIISVDNIIEENGVRKLLHTANSLGPVSAIFNLAAVLEDNLFKNQTEESFRKTSLPKFNATRHLDKVSRELCPNLEHFVVFSSICSSFGNGGQSNYGMSNSSMERICEMRKAHNLPALAIEFGPMSDVGMAARQLELNSNFTFRDIKLQSRNSFWTVLDRLLNQPHPVVISMIVEKTTDSNRSKKGLAETVRHVLGIRDIKSVNSHSTLTQFGLDSMMGIEIKEVLLNDFAIDLSVEEIANLTLAKLLEMENKSNNTRDTVEENNVHGNFVNDLVKLVDATSVAQFWTEFPRGVKRIQSSLTYGGTVEMPADKYPTLFILPTLLGYTDNVGTLCQRLNAQVLCLQFDCEHMDGSIKEMAETLSAEIKSRLSSDQKFYIIGISFGGIVALQIVRLLEAEGRTGRLWLIDASPQALQNAIYRSFNVNTKISNDDDVRKVKQEKIQTIQEYCEKFVDHGILNKFSKINKDIWIRRLILILNFESEWCFTTLLKTPVTLIRIMKDTYSPIKNYNLSQFFENPIKVHLIESNHVSIITKSKTAEIIQKEFDLERGQIQIRT